MTIFNNSGPDRTISMASIQKAERLMSRRYRNRRLGDFLKELQLSEGRATGIPTIQDELRKNGSPAARIETDDDRTFFLIEIPCREGFENINEDDGIINEAINGENESINGTINGNNGMINVSNEAINEAINDKELSLFLQIAKCPNIKRKGLMDILTISKPTIERLLKSLSATPLNLVEYQGSKKTGGYVLTERGMAYLKAIGKL